MDVPNFYEENRKLNKADFIKEEPVDNRDLIMYIMNSSFDSDGIKVEPDVCAEVDCDFTTVKEERKFSLGIDSNDGKAIEHFTEVGICLQMRDTQTTNKRRKSRKLKVTEKVSISQRCKENATITGRLRRDEIFENKKYYCNICQKSYQGRKCFREHFKNHFTVCINQYVCLICQYSAKNVGHINRHLLENHFLQDENNSPEEMFVCSLCKKRFLAKKDLERHMFLHTREGPLKCNECDFSCVNKKRLITHMSSFHGYPRIASTVLNGDDGLFECHYCGYRSEGKSALRAHIKRHIGYKSFKCPECRYECTSGGDMTKHLTIHSQDRPFVCDTCGSAFKRRSHLLIHFGGKDSCRLGNKKKRKNVGKERN